MFIFILSILLTSKLIAADRPPVPCSLYEAYKNAVFSLQKLRGEEAKNQSVPGETKFSGSKPFRHDRISRVLADGTVVAEISFLNLVDRDGKFTGVTNVTRFHVDEKYVTEGYISKLLKEFSQRTGTRKFRYEVDRELYDLMGRSPKSLSFYYYAKWVGFRFTEQRVNHSTDGENHYQNFQLFFEKP